LNIKTYLMSKKKFTLKALMVCGLAAFAQNAMAWGTDLNVNPTSGYTYKSTRVSVAYDGTIYLGRLVSTQGNDTFRKWEVLKSVDSGATFTSFDGGSFSTQRYTAFDMITAGENATDFRVFTARAFYDPTGNSNAVLLNNTNAGGSSSAVTLSEPSYTGNSRGFVNLALATDARAKNSVASPYSISLVAAKAGSYDSLIVWSDNDGGTALNRRSLYGTAKYIRSVNAAIGSATPTTSGYGRLGIVWDEFDTNTDPWGYMYMQYIYPDDLTDPGTFSGVHLISANTATYRNPAIAMSQDTNLYDIRTYIAFERDNAGNADITSRIDSVLVNAAPGFASAPNIAAGAGDQVNPHVIFNGATDSFLVVYHDKDNNSLVLKGVSLATFMLGSMQTINATFRDANTAMTNAYPRLDAIASGHAYITWNDNGVTYLDKEALVPASVQQASLSIQDIKLYPNPATDNVNLTFNAEDNDKATVTVYDITGRAVTSLQANIVKGVNSVSVPLYGVPAGNYTLRVTGTHANTSLLFTIK